MIRSRCCVEPGFQAVDFDQQHRLGVERKAEVKGRLDGRQDALVHHFQRGGNDARGDDLADRVGGVVDRSNTPSIVRTPCGIARQPDPDLGDDGQRPFAADQHADQVEARMVFRRAAELDDRAVGQHGLDAQHVIDRDAVLERVRAAGIGGHVAADRAGPLARRIGGIVIAGALQRIGEPEVDHARLDDGVAVAEVDLQDPLHPREHDHHAAAHRQAAAGQARARPARQKGHLVAVAQPHDRGHVGRSSGETRPRPGSSSRSRSRRTRRPPGRSAQPARSRRRQRRAARRPAAKGRGRSRVSLSQLRAGELGRNPDYKSQRPRNIAAPTAASPERQLGDWPVAALSRSRESPR